MLSDTTVSVGLVISNAWMKKNGHPDMLQSPTLIVGEKKANKLDSSSSSEAICNMLLTRIFQEGGKTEKNFVK